MVKNKMITSKFPFMFLLALVPVTLSIDCEFVVEVEQKLRGQGYHRNLTYTLQFQAGGTEGAGICIVSVEQQLPSGLYVNTDQLMDLKRAGKIAAKAFQRIDVELPAEQATPVTVSIIAPVNETVALWVPVHARYHRAVSGGGYDAVDIPLPDLFVTCKHNLLALCKRALNYKSAHCPTNADCEWMPVPFSMTTSTPTWTIPVGNTDDWILVAVGTSVAYFICTVAILKALHDYKIRTRVPPHWNVDEIAKKLNQMKKAV